MGYKEDIQRGRELYRKQTTRASATKKRNGTNRLAVGIGTIIEQAHNAVASLTGKGALQMQPYMDIVRGDFKSFLERICSIFPKRKKKYDPLDAAWKRGRRG